MKTRTTRNIQIEKQTRGSGRNFDFCYYSGVNIQPLNKIKGVTARRSLSPTQKETNQARANHCKK
jgi:hypothetical protein